LLQPIPAASELPTVRSAKELLSLPVSQIFSKMFMPGKLSSAHSKYENKCTHCHKGLNKSPQRQLCLDCHKNITKDIKKREGFHGRKNEPREKECSFCHTEHKGRKFDIRPFDKDIFSHDATDFPLSGKHKTLLCKKCHKKGKKPRDAPSTCFGCHEKKDPHKQKLGKLCSSCHSSTGWDKTSFDHNKTQFPLIQKHIQVRCKGCHAGKTYKKTRSDCFSCHEKHDVHGGVYTKKCSECHNPSGWKKTTFTHKKVRSIGKIALSNCIACHKKNDIHKGEFGKECRKCHSSKKWAALLFTHKKTKFPLKMKHKNLKCKECHTTPPFKQKMSTDCFSCHKAKDEHDGLFGEKCVSCHNEKGWLFFTFDHNTTDFPLKEKHKETPCKLCHQKDLSQKKLETSCASCHHFDAPHADEFGKACSPCHEEKNWKTLVFNHETTVLTELVDEQIRSCKKCYKERLGKTCFGCHEKHDVHETKEGKVCEGCHFTESWSTKVFFDHDMTKFPLIGLHAMVICEGCHPDTQYKGVQKRCVACHASEDDHKGRLGTKCDTCHNPNSWRNWNFEHNVRTKFALENAHKGLGCISCHTKIVNKEKITLPVTCVSCHQKDSIHEGRTWTNCQDCHIATSFDEIVTGR
ncbi:MAG: cytochrome C, partial [Nitrospinota bacterium]